MFEEQVDLTFVFAESIPRGPPKEKTLGYMKPYQTFVCHYILLDSGNPTPPVTSGEGHFPLKWTRSAATDNVTFSARFKTRVELRLNWPDGIELNDWTGPIEVELFSIELNFPPPCILCFVIPFLNVHYFTFFFFVKLFLSFYYSFSILFWGVYFFACFFFIYFNVIHVFFFLFFLSFYVTFTCAPRSRLQVIVIVGLPEFSQDWHQCCLWSKWILLESLHARPMYM